MKKFLFQDTKGKSVVPESADIIVQQEWERNKLVISTTFSIEGLKNLGNPLNANE